MCNSMQGPIVCVPSTQINNFKSASAKLFEIVSRVTSSKKLPVRRGLDIFSKSLGYSSHPDLIRLATGYSEPKSKPFELIPRQYLGDIGKRLSEQVEGLSVDHANDALGLLRASLTSRPSEGIENLLTKCAEYGSSDEYKDLRNPFHKALLLKRWSEVSEIIRSSDLTKLTERAKAELLRYCIIHNLNADVLFLLKNGVSPHAITSSLEPWNPLDVAIDAGNTKAQIMLVEHGADINVKQIHGYKWSLATKAIMEQAHELLNYCIDRGVLNRNSDYLTHAVISDCLNTLAAVSRLADEEDIKNATLRAFSYSRSYLFGYLYQSLGAAGNDLDFRDCIPDNSRPDWIGILRMARCIPGVERKLNHKKIAVLLVADCLNEKINAPSDMLRIIEEFLITDQSPYARYFTPDRIIETLLAEDDDTIPTILKFLDEYHLNDSLQVVYSELFTGKLPSSLLYILGFWPALNYINDPRNKGVFTKEWREEWVSMYRERAEFYNSDPLVQELPVRVAGHELTSDFLGDYLAIELGIISIEIVDPDGQQEEESGPGGSVMSTSEWTEMVKDVAETEIRKRGAE